MTIHLKCSWPLDDVPRDLLTVKEVAQLLGVTPLTVRNWDARGKLTAHRHPLNNYRVYKVADIENLIKALDSSKGIKKIVQKKEPAHREHVEPDKPLFRKLKIDVL